MEELLFWSGGSASVVAWAVVTAIVVPLTAAGIAAWVVITQVRQLDRHRVSDRKAQAITTLTEWANRVDQLIDEAVIYQQTKTGRSPNEGDRMQLRGYYVKALSLLEPKDQDVARWFNDQLDSAWTSAAENLAKYAPPKSNEVGEVRSQAWRLTAETLQRLLDWQRGTILTSWFSAQCR